MGRFRRLRRSVRLRNGTMRSGFLGMEGANKNNPERVQEEGRNTFTDTGLLIRRCLRAQSLTGLVLAGVVLLTTTVLLIVLAMMSGFSRWLVWAQRVTVEATTD